MKNKKFWAWKNMDGTESEIALELYGTIAEESWFDDDVTPQMFRDELFAGSGPVTVWLNSPGGDCVAASQIYSMLMDYKGDVTIKIDGIAASAASVIAMAGTKVLILFPNQPIDKVYRLVPPLCGGCGTAAGKPFNTNSAKPIGFGLPPFWRLSL